MRWDPEPGDPPVGAGRPAAPAFDDVPWWRRRRTRRLRQPLAIVVGTGIGLAAAAVPVGPRADTAQTVAFLQTAGFGALGLVSLVVSLLFLVVQWVSSAYSPRLILFRRSPLLGWTLAAAVGLFGYSMTAVLWAGARSTVSMLVPALAGVGTLAVITLIWLVQVNALRWVQVSSMLAAVGREGRRALDQVHPAEFGSVPRRIPPPGPGRVVHAHGDGEVLQRIDAARLLRAAAAAGAVVVFRVPVGTPLHEGLPLAEVHEGPDGGLPDDDVHRAVVRGTDRTFDQDPAFALRLFADVALRALSPAVNDPATATQALDGVHAMLRHAGRRDLTDVALTDATGAVRVVVPVRGWDELLTLGVDDVAAAVTAGQPMVRVRLARMLDDLLESVPDARRPALRRRRAAIA